MKYPDMKHVKGNMFLRISETPSTLNPELRENRCILYNLPLMVLQKDDYMESTLDFPGEPFDQSPHEMYLDEEEVEEILEFLLENEVTPEPVM